MNKNVNIKVQMKNCGTKSNINARRKNANKKVRDKNLDSKKIEDETAGRINIMTTEDCALRKKRAGEFTPREYGDVRSICCLGSLLAGMLVY